MKIAVQGFRAINSALLDFSGIALVAGCNEAGKTSICLGAGIALTGDVTPYAGMHKKDAFMLMNDGVEGAIVSVSTGDGSAQVSYPKGDMSTSGKPPRANAISAGVTDFLALADNERAHLIASYLKAVPTRDDLAETLKPHHVPDNVVDIIWEKIEKQGWDAAHERAKEQGAKLKGAWGQVTGATWGANKAPRWRPPEWMPDLDEKTVDALAAAVEQTQEAVDAAVAAAAVDADAIKRIEEECAQLDTRIEAVSEMQEAADRAETAYNEAVTARNALPLAEPPKDGLPCPHCGALVHVEKDKLVPVTSTISDAERKRRLKAIEQADALVAKLKNERDEALSALAGAKELRRSAENALAARDQMKNQPKADAEKVDVDEARAAHEEAKKRWKAKKAVDEASEKHVSIVMNQEIVKALATDGLRATVAQRKVGEFNTEVLAPLCEAAGWTKVTVDQDFRLRYGGRPYAIVAGSAQFRARAVFQVALAKIDNSCLVALDGADILDPAGRNGLFSMLAHASVTAIVGMTISNPAHAPDLVKAKMGRTYWIAQGKATPLEELKAAA